MLLRQQLIEKHEEQQLKEESLNEVKSTSMKPFFLSGITVDLYKMMKSGATKY